MVCTSPAFVKAFLAIFLCGLGWTFDESTNITFKIGDVTYENVRFGQTTTSSITIYHSNGVATVPFDRLPPDLQKRFGHDAQAALVDFARDAMAEPLKVGSIGTFGGMVKIVQILGPMEVLAEIPILYRSSAIEPGDNSGTGAGDGKPKTLVWFRRTETVSLRISTAKLSEGKSLELRGHFKIDGMKTVEGWGRTVYAIGPDLSGVTY